MLPYVQGRDITLLFTFLPNAVPRRSYGAMLGTEWDSIVSVALSLGFHQTVKNIAHLRSNSSRSDVYPGRR